MTRNPGANGAIAKRRGLERIRLLCQSGTGLEAIVGPLCHAIRDLIGASSGSVFWLDANRAPEGFYHDCAPAEIKDIFASRLEELFILPGEFNMLTLTEQVEPSIGRLLAPGAMEDFWQGNVYKYLCVPLGHRHMLDMRVDVDGIGRALICVWNGPDQPFLQSQAEMLRPVQRLISLAIQGAKTGATWRAVSNDPAQFITNNSGDTLIAIDDEAERLLQESGMLTKTLSMSQQLYQAPGFAQSLAAALLKGLSATLHLPVANGRLVATATLVRPRTRDGTGEMMSVSLRSEVSLHVLAVERLMSLSLTPFCREIALFGIKGGARGECEAEFGVSAEALKKHSRAIYDALDIERWADLQGVL